MGVGATAQIPTQPSLSQGNYLQRAEVVRAELRPCSTNLHEQGVLWTAVPDLLHQHLLTFQHWILFTSFKLLLHGPGIGSNRKYATRHWRRPWAQVIHRMEPAAGGRSSSGSNLGSAVVSWHGSPLSTVTVPIPMGYLQGNQHQSCCCRGFLLLRKESFGEGMVPTDSENTKSYAIAPADIKIHEILRTHSNR